MITKHIEDILFSFNVNLVVNTEVLGNAFLDILRLPEVKERDIFLASFLSFLMCRQNKDEIKSCISAIIKFEELEFVPHPRRKKVMGLCGSGKKGIKTVNISTPSAIIAASCGANIIKPGSQSTSSRTGSADFFSVLGVRKIPSMNINNMLDELSFAFISIEDRLSKFDKVYGQRFYVPTILGFVLATLSITETCDKIIYGLAHPNQNLSYELIKDICNTSPTIITTKIKENIYLDEMAYGEIWTYNDNGKLVENPQNFIHKWNDYSMMNFIEKNTLEENVLTAVKAIKGKGERAIQDIYSLNSGLYLREMGIVSSLERGYILSKDAIKSGHAYDHFRKVLKFLDGDISKIERVQ